METVRPFRPVQTRTEDDKQVLMRANSGHLRSLPSDRFLAYACSDRVGEGSYLDCPRGGNNYERLHSTFGCFIGCRNSHSRGLGNSRGCSPAWRTITASPVAPWPAFDI